MDETEVNFIFCHLSIKSHVFQDESARNQPKTPVLHYSYSGYSQSRSTRSDLWVSLFGLL